MDDEFDIVNLFREVVKNRNYDVFGFTNPLKALEDYQKNYDQYWMVISHFRMPQMYGFDLVINTAITGKLDLTKDQSHHMADKSCSSVIVCSNLWYIQVTLYRLWQLIYLSVLYLKWH